MSDRAIFYQFAACLRAPDQPATPDFITGDAVRNKAAMAVYRNNVRSSLSKALGEKFPVINQLVGEAFFKFAANAYFNEHPPRSPLIADYGDVFPKFLENFKPAETTPYLADMARLEIAWLEAWRTEDVTPLDAEEILAAGDGDPSGLRLTFHPSLRLIRSNFPIGAIWRRHQPYGREEKINADAGDFLIVSRPANDVTLVNVSMGVWVAISALTKGHTITSAFSRAFAADKNFDPQAAFQTLFNGKLVTSATAASDGENP